MQPVIRFDLREFNSAMKKAIELSHRAPAQVINSRAYAVTKKAHDATPVATRGQIQAALGATLVAQRKNKKGKIQRKYSHKPTKLAYLLVNARQKRRGESPFFGGAMEREAAKLIASRLRAVGSLRAGWRGALRAFARAISGMGGSGGPTVKKPGKGVVARPGTHSQAEIEYNLTTRRTSGQVDPRVETALANAFAAEHAELKRHLESKLQDDFRKNGLS